MNQAYIDFLKIGKKLAPKTIVNSSYYPWWVIWFPFAKIDFLAIYLSANRMSSIFNGIWK